MLPLDDKQPVRALIGEFCAAVVAEAFQDISTWGGVLSAGDYRYNVVRRLNEKFDFVHDYLEVVGMTNKKVTGGWKGFTDVRLLPMDIEGFLATDRDAETVVEMATAVLMDGYKIGVYWDFEGQEFGCSLTCKDPASPNNGYTIVAKAPTAVEAIALVLYKHNVVAEHVWDGVEGGRGGGYS